MESMVNETLMHVVADSETVAEAWMSLEKKAKWAAPVYERELWKRIANFGQNSEYAQALFESLPGEFAATEQAWIFAVEKASMEYSHAMLPAVERQMMRHANTTVEGAALLTGV
ncbi:hypothetical protein FVE85_5153 [Porphyridium purpureum]|uniref:Uncharacterized protein n=1 Tax=Porphyridium purpureum TaxID=35688 RepID=A0A5J4Z2V7_PORPP|nr:hypothetical protein FVE85_5153 [Porphyridium purpureum]|eukprot:POR1793..scf295_1